MILDISPTRMELLKLRKKLVLARRGHKLLKDKLDELIRLVLKLAREMWQSRALVDAKLAQAGNFMTFAGYVTFPEAVAAALISSGGSSDLEISLVPRLNLRVPEFTLGLDRQSTGGYGFVQTSQGLDYSLSLFREAAQNLVELAGREKQAMMIADEIEKTKRRVNALEYILIPNIEETIRYITMKLEENERNTKTQLMRIKDIVRAPRAQVSAYPGVSRYPSL